MQNSSIKILFILCPGHSGSTLLDLLIGGHPDIISGGEFRTWDKQLNRPCTCGAETVWRCDFWQAVNTELARHGYDIADIEQHGRDTDDFADFNTKLFQAMLAHSGASVILDSSKRKSRLKMLKGAPEAFDVHTILLVRNPFGVIASNKKRGRSVVKSSLKLNAHHLRQLKQAGRHTSFIWYEDLARTPETEIARLMKEAGLAWAYDQLHPESHVYHNLGGNGMRNRPISEISVDDSWKTRLGTREKVIAAILTLPARCFIGMTKAICRFQQTT